MKYAMINLGPIREYNGKWEIFHLRRLEVIKSFVSRYLELNLPIERLR